MVDATHKSFSAADRSYYAILKREIHNLAREKGFTEKRIAELDVVVAEMTSNLAKYTSGGELLAGYFDHQGEAYIELICLDTGPGMKDISKMMKDGYSSANTMGHGLGSIARMSDTFEVFSQPGWGTVLLSRVYKIRPTMAKTRSHFEYSSVIVAKPGEKVSGDGCYVKRTDNLIKLMLADGLGHGAEANLAVNEAVKAFKLCAQQSPVEIIRELHPAVRKTRGLVATIVVYDIKAKQLSIGGVGNISTKLLGPMLSKTHLAYNGIIGHNIPNTMNDLRVSISDYNQIILCSDGIRSRWEPNRFPSMSRYNLGIQAAAIYRDFARLTDDMSVVIAKFR